MCVCVCVFVFVCVCACVCVCVCVSSTARINQRLRARSVHPQTVRSTRQHQPAQTDKKTDVHAGRAHNRCEQNIAASKSDLN